MSTVNGATNTVPSAFFSRIRFSMLIHGIIDIPSSKLMASLELSLSYPPCLIVRRLKIQCTYAYSLRIYSTFIFNHLAWIPVILLNAQYNLRIRYSRSPHKEKKNIFLATNAKMEFELTKSAKINFGSLNYQS